MAVVWKDTGALARHHRRQLEEAVHRVQLADRFCSVQNTRSRRFVETRRQVESLARPHSTTGTPNGPNYASPLHWRKSDWNSGWRRRDPEDLLGAIGTMGGVWGGDISSPAEGPGDGHFAEFWPIFLFLPSPEKYVELSAWSGDLVDDEDVLLGSTR